MLLGVTFSTAACKKCVTCTKSGSNDVEICKENYSGVPGAYNAAISQQESLGYDCN